MFEPDEAHPNLAQYLTDEQQALLAQALILILGSPDQTGHILLVINSGKLQLVKPQPSLRPNHQALTWLRRTNGTPFE